MARERRKLVAILAADVIGYSRLMGRDESGTLARLREALLHSQPDLLARRSLCNRLHKIIVASLQNHLLSRWSKSS